MVKKSLESSEFPGVKKFNLRRRDEVEFARDYLNKEEYHILHSSTFDLISTFGVDQTSNPKRSAESFAKYWSGLGYKVAEVSYGKFGKGYPKGKLSSNSQLMIAYTGTLTRKIYNELLDCSGG